MQSCVLRSHLPTRVYYGSLLVFRSAQVLCLETAPGVLSSLFLGPLSHAFSRSGDDRALPHRDHLVWGPFSQEPAQFEGLFPGRPQCALVGYRAVHRLGRNQHAHRDRHAGAVILRQFPVSATGARLSAGAHRHFGAVSAAILPRRDVHRLRIDAAPIWRAHPAAHGRRHS